MRNSIQDRLVCLWVTRAGIDPGALFSIPARTRSGVAVVGQFLDLWQVALIGWLVSRDIIPFSQYLCWFSLSVTDVGWVIESRELIIALN